ncbi:hypothetical protein [Actinosynnema mirum]|uniref:hypothetical protein n=1 Tax=Actinosynnema mirum TaxID=40567 RepID=UPI00019ACB3F|nr:hypothetical protein [Actinosynnema mirum]
MATTAATIGLSVLALLRDRERAEPGRRAQFHALLEGPDPVKAAVEELLHRGSALRLNRSLILPPPR